MKITFNTDTYRDQYPGSTIKDKAKTVAQSTLATGQDTVLSSLAKTQDTLQTGLSMAQDAWQQNVKRANKNLKKARKKMKPVLESAQESVQSGLDLAQDAWQQNVKNANKNLKKAKKSITDVQQSVQDQLAGYARKRKRARAVFRLGLLVGIVLVLLYTPWPGSDTRRQLVTWWQRTSQYPRDAQRAVTRSEPV